MLQNAAAQHVSSRAIRLLKSPVRKACFMLRDQQVASMNFGRQATKAKRMQSTMRRFAATALAAAAIVNLNACTSVYTESATAGAGIAGAAVASKVTRNAAVATGIGLGAVAAAKAGVQYTERVVHRDTQNKIASAAGPLAIGAVAPWNVKHAVPVEADEHGRVTVSRAISTGALDCKEIVFSVDADATKDKPASSAFYVASICRDGNAWKWASAEPATERWGALQ